ncbi:hypothetical protein R6G85_02375 [Actinotignum urinale]|uniref:hypothetical protein n=1 Tax=Actinotignum urinale TaxID=190146 RepID=UPI002A8339A7|nr:hypothetical protein [Actinotignum urinale]MDY5151333.1 hypothetical protein [Actinotignum urinale]
MAETIAKLTSSLIAGKDTAQVVLGRVSVPVDGGAPKVFVQGSSVALQATWLTTVTVSEGDTVAVLISGSGNAPKTAIVLDKVETTPAPATGVVTAVPAGSTTVKVDALWRGSVDAGFVGSAPGVGAKVMLVWQGGKPVVLGTITSPQAGNTSSSSASSGVTSGQQTQSSGTCPLRAVDSGSFTIGRGWNPYYRQNLMQGSYGGRTLQGCWFYGSAGTMLAGAQIANVRMYIAARRRAGNYNANLNLVVSPHNLQAKNSSPAFTSDAVTVTLPPNWGGGWVTLPASWGAMLAQGYGIGIRGGAYGGVTGVGENPSSGLIHVDWRR